MPIQTHNNPFRARVLPRSKRQHTGFVVRSSRVLLGLGMAVLTAVALLVIFGFARQTAWLPGPLRNLTTIPALSGEFFREAPGLNREQARVMYRNALEELGSGQAEEALASFKRLESVYPGMLDLLWLHEAEAYAGQGNEWAVQKKLTALLDNTQDSPFRAVALYRMGQSQFRGSEWEKAETTFTRVRNDFPKSEVAVGSLYYLGALKAKEASDGNPQAKAQAIKPLKEYLSLCINCKFSAQAAEFMQELLPQPTSEEATLMGLAMAAGVKDAKTATVLLKHGDFSKTWLALAKLQLDAGEKAAGIATLKKGLPLATDADDSREGVDLLIAHVVPPSLLMTDLQTLVAAQPKAGADYILWRLAMLDDAHARSYYEAILQHDPQSDYAPESAWNLLWPKLEAGRSTEFLAAGREFLQKYPYARSAPKVLFWMGRLQERTDAVAAAKIYQRLLRHYADSYYAFRADGRLRAVAGGQHDPGWRTRRGRHYPPVNADLATLNILPPVDAFAPGRQDIGAARLAMAKELQAIGASDDMSMLLMEATGSVPPALESWALQVSGDRARGLRVIRDALATRTQQEFQAGSGTFSPSQASKDELKLLYPVYFAEEIRMAAARTGLDPFLIQSLMREESYFNEFAISTSNARGLMQLLPSTAREVANWESLGGFGADDLFMPEINIRLGSRYLQHLHELFDDNSMPSVGAYNGGPNAMKRWVRASNLFADDPDMFVERIPYEQSRDYIKKVFASWWNYDRLYGDSADNRPL